jgi:protein arginine kinase
MKLETLLNTIPDWMPDRNAHDGIVMGSIVRMVRNLPGYPFPGWSTEETRAGVAAKLLPAIKELRGFKTSYCAEMNQLSYGQRRALLTRKQLTPSMAARQDGCHVVIHPRKPITIMVNEEEHMVAHIFLEGLNFDKGLAELDKLDTQLQEDLAFAYTPQHGYLTSIPSEAGDGLQLYSILHLPALTAANMMNQVTKALEKLHVSISPYFSDAQDDTGHLFVLFSIPGPEDSIDEVKETFLDVVNHLIRREQQVRRRLLAEPGQHLQDAIARAYGLLTNCRRLSIKELRDSISMLRLGTLLHIIIWEEDEQQMLMALNHFGLQQACITALAADNEDSTIHLQRASAAREFLKTHPHHFSDNSI